MRRYGELYIIKNKQSTKVYIGKTYNGIEHRWKRHIQASKAGCTKLYQSMRDIGIDKFYIEKLGEYEELELEKKEIEYIAKYDSFSNGYNSNCGGDLGVRFIVDETEIMADYYCGIGYAELAAKYGCSTSKIKVVVSKNKDTAVNRETKIKVINTAKKVVMYTNTFVPIGQFDSIKNAHMWILKNHKDTVSKYNFYTEIKVAVTTGALSYGHRWQLLEDLYYTQNGTTIVFKTVFDKQAYIDGGKLCIQDGIATCNNKKVKSIIDASKSKICRVCGSAKTVNSKVCLKCSIQGSKMTADEICRLKLLVARYSLTAVGKIYGISGNAIKKRCTSHGINIKEEKLKYAESDSRYNELKLSETEIIRLSCKNEKTTLMLDKNDESVLKGFKSASEAARFIIKLGASTASEESVVGHISYSIKKKGTAFGYKWKYI